MHPLTRVELADDFDLRHSLQYGQLPSAYVDDDPRAFLSAYVKTYLREEVLQEGLTRNLGAFARFMESISFSQGMPLNVSNVARECHVARKVVEDYVTILEDLTGAERPPAHVAYRDLGYELFYWRTSVGVEVDLVLYGERGLHAFEVKRASRLRQADLAGLRAFRADYPTARCTLAYSGTKRYTEGAIEIVPLDQWLAELPARL